MYVYRYIDIYVCVLQYYYTMVYHIYVASEGREGRGGAEGATRAGMPGRPLSSEGGPPTGQPPPARGRCGALGDRAAPRPSARSSVVVSL